MELRKAKKSSASIKMALQGPSGSGKTYSALELASGLANWNKICVIDTENSSADLYSEKGSYNVVSIDAPYTPEKYIEAIELCERSEMQVIIIDSLSHEWDGMGGILDIHGQMAGNSFANWSKVTPRHNALVQKILNSKVHIIATFRTKQDYVLTDKNGKMVPEKVGLKSVTRDGMDYEFTVVFDLDIKHQVSVSKDRTGVFANSYFVISQETGQQIYNWCNNEENVEAMIEACTTRDELSNIYRNHFQARTKYHRQILAKSVELKSKFESNGVSH